MQKIRNANSREPSNHSLQGSLPRVSGATGPKQGGPMSTIPEGSGEHGGATGKGDSLHGMVAVQNTSSRNNHSQLPPRGSVGTIE